MTRHSTPVLGRKNGESAEVADPAFRIVLVAYACDPTRGTESALGWGWAESLARRGHIVELLTRASDNVQSVIEAIERDTALRDRIRPHFVPIPADPWWFRLLPSALRGQAEILFRYTGWQRDALRLARHRGLGEADLVHHVSFGSLVGGSVLRKLGLPLVFGPVGGGQTSPRSHRRYLADAYPQERRRELLWVRGLSRRPSCRATLRQAAVVLTTNRDTADLARRLGRSETRMMLCDGVQDALLHRPETSTRPNKAPTVLWVGRLAAIKAPELALQAFAHMRATAVPQARLTFVGEGPLRPRLQRATRELRLEDSVDFLGQVSWQRTLAAYDHADVLAFTSLRDSFGAQTLEAWARGLPVVHLDHQGVGDFSPPGGAVPVPLGSPADLPQRFGRALSEVLADAEARRTMGEAASAWAREHTWTRKAKEAEQLYHDVLAGGTGPDPGAAHSTPPEHPSVHAGDSPRRVGHVTEPVAVQHTNLEGRCG